MLSCRRSAADSTRIAPALEYTDRMANAKSSASLRPTKASATPRGARTRAPRATPSVSPIRGMAVEDWVKKKAQGWQATVVGQLISIARKAAPGATTSIKWAQPVFEQGGPFAFIKVAKAHVTFGFWRGAELKDPKGILEGGAVMRHLKITAPEAVDEKSIADLVRQAVALNRAKGDPTARSQPKR